MPLPPSALSRGLERGGRLYLDSLLRCRRRKCGPPISRFAPPQEFGVCKSPLDGCFFRAGCFFVADFSRSDLQAAVGHCCGSCLAIAVATSSSQGGTLSPYFCCAAWRITAR